ncbi:hypothetical protein Esi_0292_0017 [Ectocarpus siliculosus]|uniref:Uncharacterized protein n=1 Tax=Ectocarpus siliculosus TaxID=2880 RepID=D8LKB2_ECTSI|nr:hypothetical protein Esi_0292_0017 [Ectocarpus siliculosus]|eukprot:CBN76057.1 hypothetical protein Esi_0292_0017 [Ectocarpus siliculosus]
MDFRGEVLFWSKAMHERVGARTPYQRYACATASVFIAGAIVIGDAWMSLRRRWRLSRRDRAQNPVPRNVSSRALVLYSDPAYAAPLVDGDRQFEEPSYNTTSLYDSVRQMEPGERNLRQGGCAQYRGPVAKQRASGIKRAQEMFCRPTVCRSLAKHSCRRQQGPKGINVPPDTTFTGSLVANS